MNLYQCEAYAKKNGFDSLKFEADFPVGTMQCKWIDAWFGFFEVEGLGDGFVMTRYIDEMFPDLVCRIVGETK